MKKPKINSQEGESRIIEELVAIKILLAIQLMRNGVKQGEVAKALHMDQGNLSRLIPARLAKVSKKRKSNKCIGSYRKK